MFSSLVCIVFLSSRTLRRNNKPTTTSTDTKSKTLTLKSEGKGGIQEVVDALSDDAIQYVGVRISGVDRQGTAVSRRSKFLYVVYEFSSPSSVLLYLGYAIDRHNARTQVRYVRW